MTIFPCSTGAITLDKKLAKWLRDQRGDMTFAAIFEESGSATVHDIQAGAVRAIHHLGAVGCGPEETEMHAGGCVW